MIYLVCDVSINERAPSGSVLAQPSDSGFVHCCDAAQIDGVISKWFPSADVVRVVELDPTTLRAETRYEKGSLGEDERFPHVYGPISASEIHRAQTIRRVSGAFAPVTFSVPLPSRPVDVVELVAPEMEPLRRAVLRDGDEDADVTLDEDTDPQTLHFGVRVDGSVVATASFLREPCPLLPDAVDPWKLRFMAIDPDFQGTGLGRTVLLRGVAEITAQGAGVLWADARDNAISFYERLGFVVLPDSAFISDVTGIPHVVVALNC